MSKNFSGSSISELCKGHNPWSFYIPPISASKYHSVLYKLPVDGSIVPQPYISSHPKHWDDEHVRMPFSPQNLFPVMDSGNMKVLKSRWDIICKVFEKPIRSVQELENAINSYNSSLPKFSALEYLFGSVLSEEESEAFFENVLPRIVNLALRLPEILPGSLPILERNKNKSISLSQLQVSSLLANAFLCTFPWGKVSTSCPGVNFVRLYAAYQQGKRVSCVIEKLKCIIHYFRRITNSEPKGVLTFERIYLPKNKIPRWDALQNNLGNTRVHIISTGTIEDDGLGFLQVDFANKNVGGGVLGYGCVQEEIRFVICPELLISRLFTAQLDDSEAIIVRGVERFSKYTGFGETFKWEGNFVDDTPFDNYGRRQTAISVIDATLFYKVDNQYYPSAILRELSKAYVGFYSHHTENLAPVATGNWGCGAFRGDPNLKTLIQLMACNAAHRDLVYYTFGNVELQETFYNMYLFIATNRITTCELWRIFCRFANAKIPSNQLYSFIQQSCFDSRNKSDIVENIISPILSKISPKKNRSSPKKEKISPKKERSSSEANKLLKRDNINNPTTSKYFIDLDTASKDNSVKDESNSTSSSPIEDIIPSSQPENDYPMPMKKSKEKGSFNEKLFEENHNEILAIFSQIDGPPITNKNVQNENDTMSSTFDKIDTLKDKPVEPETIVEDMGDDTMDMDGPIEEVTPKLKVQKKKITDYFAKM